MSAESAKLEILTQQLETLCQQFASGDVILSNSAKEGKLHICNGHLLYATSDFHRVRRWHRALKKNSPNWKPQPHSVSFDSEKPWEYQLLYQGVANEQLTLTQAKSIIGYVTLEILFSLLHCTDMVSKAQPSPEATSNVSLGLGLSYSELEPVLSKGSQLRAQWEAAGLGSMNPTEAPILRKPVHSQTLSGWDKYLNGKFTLWDISLRLGKSITSVTRALLPLIKKGLVQLRAVPDLPAPTFNLRTASWESTPGESETGSIQPNQQKPLIACIDDSPVVFQVMKNILEPAGYQVVGLQDPVQAIAQVARYKPDLIFLDLVMPDANGYTICQFLRKAPIFKNTPVIILTSRDNVIDRSRTKLIGASGFLGKPPDPEETLKTVRRFLLRSSDSVEEENNYGLEISNNFELGVGEF
ncbi:response regulator [Capilliphycus salinus ALCB114379]|uniref:response regulator n=1 Tax=Capilliphycus salinus TaxID=2768948 RepID=UPI0039A78240